MGVAPDAFERREGADQHKQLNRMLKGKALEYDSRRGTHRVWVFCSIILLKYFSWWAECVLVVGLRRTGACFCRLFVGRGQALANGGTAAVLIGFVTVVVVGLLLVVVASASYWVYRMEELRYSLTNT